MRDPKKHPGLNTLSCRYNAVILYEFLRDLSNRSGSFCRLARGIVIGKDKVEEMNKWDKEARV